MELTKPHFRGPSHFAAGGGPFSIPRQEVLAAPPREEDRVLGRRDDRVPTAAPAATAAPAGPVAEGWRGHDEACPRRARHALVLRPRSGNGVRGPSQDRVYLGHATRSPASIGEI